MEWRGDPTQEREERAPEGVQAWQLCTENEAQQKAPGWGLISEKAKSYIKRKINHILLQDSGRAFR